MSFINNITKQAKMHKYIMPQDVIKLCYQAAFGAEHLMQNTVAAEQYFYSELNAINNSCTADDTLLYEELSSDISRINLRKWKEKKLNPNWLFNMFCQSATGKLHGENVFLSYINDVKKLIEGGIFNFSLHEFNAYYDGYIKHGITAVHHSEKYRINEKPSYRIVDSKFLRIIPILEKISAHIATGEENCIITIDGRCGSGKSTMATQLSSLLNIDVIHMDDFFLPPEKRTEKRLNEPGGNVDYERFSQEVVKQLFSNEAFSYKVFDCTKMGFNGTKQFNNSPIKLIEGTYSQHPYFAGYGNINVFSTIDEKSQMQRIAQRNGSEIAKIFKEKWIPLEELYFAACYTAKKATLVV